MFVIKIIIFGTGRSICHLPSYIYSSQREFKRQETTNYKAICQGCRFSFDGSLEIINRHGHSDGILTCSFVSKWRNWSYRRLNFSRVHYNTITFPYLPRPFRVTGDEVSSTSFSWLHTSAW